MTRLKSQRIQANAFFIISTHLKNSTIKESFSYQSTATAPTLVFASTGKQNKPKEDKQSSERQLVERRTSAQAFARW